MKTNIIFFALFLIICHSSFGQNGDIVIDINKLNGSWHYNRNIDSKIRMYVRKDENDKKIYFGQTINIFDNGSFTEQRTVPCGNDTDWRFKNGFWKIENNNILKLEYSNDSTFIKYKILKLDINELIIVEDKSE